MIKRIASKEQELGCKVLVKAYVKELDNNETVQQISIDNTITPLYCSICKKQLDGFYFLDGSRYGQVGSIKCSCGAEIHCTDSDNIVDYLKTFTYYDRVLYSRRTIDFTSLYRLNEESFALIKLKYGFDIFERYRNQTVDLATLIADIESTIQPESILHTNHSSGVFERLPSVINRWFDLLNDDKYALLAPIHHAPGIHDADLVENTGKKSIIQTVKNWLVKLKSL